MAFEQRNGSGALFKNTKKEAGSKQPDYTGNALSPSGEYFELSAWLKESSNGKKFMSVALQPKFGSEHKTATKPSVPGFSDMEDDIPFNSVVLDNHTKTPEDTKIKQCFKCKEEKLLAEFYRHSEMADGHLNKCKECTKSDSTKHRIGNLDKIREYDRDRGKLPHRIERNTNYTRIFRQKDGHGAAHSAVARAIRRGDLKRQPCEMCGSEVGIHAHHDDYSQPLNIMWLCVIHHKARHAYLEYLEQNDQVAA